MRYSSQVRSFLGWWFDFLFDGDYARCIFESSEHMILHLFPIRLEDSIDCCAVIDSPCSLVKDVFNADTMILDFGQGLINSPIATHPPTNHLIIKQTDTVGCKRDTYILLVNCGVVALVIDAMIGRAFETTVIGSPSTVSVLPLVPVMSALYLRFSLDVSLALTTNRRHRYGISDRCYRLRRILRQFSSIAWCLSWCAGWFSATWESEGGLAAMATTGMFLDSIDCR